MAVTEQARHDVYTYFQETMGNERAATLMELLPPVGWGDVATKQHVEQHIALVQHDIEHLRVATTKDIEHLREWAELRFDSVDARFESVAVRFDTVDQRMGTMATKADIHELRAEMYRAFKAQTISLVFAMVGIAGLAAAAM